MAAIPLGQYRLPNGPQGTTSFGPASPPIPVPQNPSADTTIPRDLELEDPRQWHQGHADNTPESPTPSTYHRQSDANISSDPFADPPNTSYNPGFSTGPYQKLPQRQDENLDIIHSDKRTNSKGRFFKSQTRAIPSSPTGSPPQGTPPGRRRLLQPSAWRWKVSWNMYLFLLFGVACAFGHHAFYAALDGKLATDQVRMLRYGTLLAVASKAGLSAAVVVAFRQILWTTVRSRLMSIAALDSLFAATDDLVALVNWELIKNAKVVVLLASFVWLSSLVIILTSNTLLVEPRLMITRSDCPGVRTLNFTFEETADWRNPKQIDNLYEMPVSLWNTTKPENEEPEGWFDYYTAPSPALQRTASIGAYLGQPVSRKNGQLETCGSGWNCSFVISFVAPAYKCTELASGVDSKAKNLTQESGSIGPPFDTDILLPKGRFSYYVFATGGEYSSMQMKDADIGGIPRSKPPYPKTMGAFRTEPIVWVGYSKIANPSKPVPLNPSNPDWDTAFIPTLFACENYESNYHLNISYNDAIQSASLISLEHLRPVINTTYLPHIDSHDGTTDNITATPKSNYIYPQDVGPYRRTAAYHSLGYMLRSFINGTVAMDPDRGVVNPVANTNAVQTKLIDPANNFFPYPDLAARVQSFYQDMILSLLGSPQFVEVVWALFPDVQSGARTELPPPDDNNLHVDHEVADRYRMYPCEKSRTANVYHYNVRDLWIVYGIACLLALFGVVAGAVAIHGENEGAVRDTRFSSIIAATRGPALEKVRWVHNSSGAKGDAGSSSTTVYGAGWGDHDGGDSVMRVSENVKKLKVGYGLLKRGEGFARDGGGARDLVIGSSIGGGGDGDLGGDDEGYGDRGRNVRDIIASGELPSKGYYYGFGLEGDVEQIPRKRIMGRKRAGSV